MQSGMFTDGVYLAFLPGGAYTERARRVPMVPMGKTLKKKGTDKT